LGVGRLRRDEAADRRAPPEPRGLAYFTGAAALTPAHGSPPTVICGPGDADQAHQTDESCSVERLEAAAEGTFEIARRWCGL
jgi:succinyl-diaminopimelate desuccinylase